VSTLWVVTDERPDGMIVGSLPPRPRLKSGVGDRSRVGTLWVVTDERPDGMIVGSLPPRPRLKSGVGDRRRAV